MKYEVAIIGAGPAGLTAGIYAGRSGLKTLVIAKEIGGTANSILSIENWPGFKGTGKELMKKFYEQMKTFNVDIINEEARSIEKKGKEFIIKTEGKTIEAESIILATGIRRNNLKISGEERLKGKGVSYCVDCDAFFFKKREVSIFGRDESVIEPALALAKIANKVYVIFDGDEKRIKELKKNKKIKIIHGTPERINGKEKVESITLIENGKRRGLNIDGIFIELGANPIAGLTKNLNLKINSDGFIVVDDEMKTSAEGVFAAGDITNSKLKQVLTSSSQGAVAAKSASIWIKNRFL